MKREKNFLVNTVFLYLLTFSNYFFNFLTVPYQTRVLGPNIYGKLGIATSFVNYFQLILDFGFILSATSLVAKNRNDKTKLSNILSTIIYCKVIISSILFIILLILFGIVPSFRIDWKLYFIYYLFAVVNSFIPDFLYRGLEEMKIITIRTVIIKAFFSFMIFILLKDKSQYLIIPLLYLLGAFFSIIGVFMHIYIKLGLRIKKVTLNSVIKMFKNSSMYFLSRIASTVYTTTNMIIIGELYKGQSITGLYSSVDKLTSTSKTMFSPIADSLYPYMIEHKDFKLVKKILVLLMPLIIMGSLIIGLFANELCALLFGEAYYSAGNILRIMLPTVVIALPSYIFGFPVLTPLGLEKYANYSVIIGSVNQVFLIIVFYMMGYLNIISICIITIITEMIVLIFRLAIIMKNRNL